MCGVIRAEVRPDKRCLAKTLDFFYICRYVHKYFMRRFFRGMRSFDNVPTSSFVRRNMFSLFAQLHRAEPAPPLYTRRGFVRASAQYF